MTVPAALPADEADRLASLRTRNILDSDREERFDRLTRLASTLLETPIAAISLIDADRQWFKSEVGLGITQTPRDVAFCSHAILDRQPMVIEDAAADPRFMSNPLVTGEPNIRFYAGAPLMTPEGHCLGTLCVIDSRPRTLDLRQLQVLRDLSAIAADELALGRSLEMERAERLRAEHAAAEKARVLAVVAHEVRNPLGAICGLGESLRQASAPGAAAADALAIETAATDLLDTLNSLLDQASLECGQFRINAAPFSFASKLRKIETLFGPRARSQGLRLVVDPPPAGADAIIADRHRIRQILINLVGNALKFTRRGGVRLSCELTPIAGASAEAALLRVHVADTGPGLTAEECATIFDGKGAASALDHSAGLGLGISRQLARALGGDLTVDSSPGVGSTFTLTTPVALAKPAQRIEGARVFVIEDHPGQARIYQSVLTALGCHCDFAANGADALRVLADVRYDVIIVDKRLPDMPGPKIVTSLRACDSVNAFTPIIAVSADDLGAVDAAFAGLAIAGALSKPIDAGSLAQTIGLALAQPQTTGATVA